MTDQDFTGFTELNNVMNDAQNARLIDNIVDTTKPVKQVIVTAIIRLMYGI